MDTAHQLGVGVVWEDLPGDLVGHYDHHHRRIVLDLVLTDYQTRSVLAHELSHARWGDQPTDDTREHARRERRADAEAARTLISPAEYALAERLVGPHPGALAAELGVSRWVVEAWQREADHGRGWTTANH